MAKYYGKLKDNVENRGSRRFYKILSSLAFSIFVIFIICAFIGIFGDTKRRDETRKIVVENSELKQEVGNLEMKIEKLEKENKELLETLEKNFIEAGSTLSKPEGDLTDSEKDEDDEEDAEQEDKKDDEKDSEKDSKKD